MDQVDAPGLSSTDAPGRSQPLGISVTIDHDRAYLTLVGDMVSANALRVLNSVRRHLDQPHITHVIVDLDAVTFLDAAGLRALVRSRQHADQHHKNFLIQGHHGHVARVIDVTGRLTNHLTNPNTRPAEPDGTTSHDGEHCPPPPHRPHFEDRA